MVQVEVVPLDQARPVAAVERVEPVDFAPELGLVHVVVPKQWALHVPRDQGLVEVPDHRNDVLGEELTIHDSDEAIWLSTDLNGRGQFEV